MIKEIVLKNASSEWSQTNKEYNIIGDLILNDIINEANKYNKDVNIEITIHEAVDWDKLIKLRKHINYKKDIDDEFINKYINNKVERVELIVVENYGKVFDVTFIIDYLYYYQ